MGKRPIGSLLLMGCLLLSLLAAPIRADTSVEAQLEYSCTYGEKTDISQHQLTEKQLEELYYTMQYAGQLPWYASDEYTYYYNERTGLVLEFEPILLDESYDRMLYEQAVGSILNDCSLEGMEPWQKALAIHDYLILNCVYDESLQLKTGYDLLIRGSTICSGYAALYQDLLLRLGIPCLQVDSDPMEHVWNLVQLDGQWYHVDVTWDDPSPDTYGLVDHSYFLKTDEQMRRGEDPHYDWNTDITCTDTRFADAFWDGVYSGVLFTDSDTCYYLRDADCVNSLYRRSISRKEETRIYKEKNSYRDIGHGKYTYFHTGLTLREGRLWLCGMDQVLSVTLNGKDKRTEYTWQDGSRYLAGCAILGDSLLLTACDHDGNGITETVELSPTEDHRHSFSQTVLPPTCTAHGRTEAVCDCGLTATGDPKAALGHSWQETASKKASLFDGGYTDSLCTTCGETEHQELPKLEVGQWLEERFPLLIVLGVSMIVWVIQMIRRKKS